MFRSAIARSLKASAPRVIRTPAPFHIRSSPIAAQVPQFTPCFAQGVRLYSAPAGLSKTEAEGRIVNLLKNFDKINGSSHFSNDLGLDSLDTVEVVMAIEEEFSIEIPDKEADQIHSGKLWVKDLDVFGTELTRISRTVDKAVEYILAQPDAH
ncbi:Acyl carrier protein [Penicillium sp. DV-2018c]|nr:Acyl carrier protein [Penicillium sp. DV-2018c]KAJ5582109.1 Acyl carrier protein [Penicillium sp. DV-2018c]